jgi:hypothetical protein
MIAPARPLGGRLTARVSAALDDFLAGAGHLSDAEAAREFEARAGHRVHFDTVRRRRNARDPGRRRFPGGRPVDHDRPLIDALLAAHPGASDAALAREYARRSGRGVYPSTIRRRRLELEAARDGLDPDDPERGLPDLPPERIAHRAEVLRRWHRRRALRAAPRARLRWEMKGD